MGDYGLRGLAIWVAAASFAPPPPPNAFADLPQVEIVEFDVHGRTLAEIRESLWHDGPALPGTDERVAGLTTSSVDWNGDWNVEHIGGCRYLWAAVDFHSVVQLPRLASDDAPPEVQARWKLIRAEIERHEAEHVRINEIAVEQIRNALVRGDCDQAQAAAERLWKRAGSDNDAFDASEAGGLDRYFDTPLEVKLE